MFHLFQKRMRGTRWMKPALRAAPRPGPPGHRVQVEGLLRFLLPLALGSRLALVFSLRVGIPLTHLLLCPGGCYQSIPPA